MTLKVDNIQNENASEANVVLNSNGSISIPSQIKHVGDDDTLIEFETDTVKLQTGGSTRLTVNSSGNIIASNGNVGINKSVPDEALHVHATGDTQIAAEFESSSAESYIQFSSSDNTQVLFGKDTADACIQVGSNDIFKAKSGGDCEIVDGNLVIGTAGHGIDFSSHTGGTDTSNTTTLLDDYEEGDWSPTFTGSTAAGNYVASNGHFDYVKVGNVISVFGRCGITRNSVGSGSFLINNLPYPYAANNAVVGPLQWDNINFSTSPSGPNTAVVMQRSDASNNILQIVFSGDNTAAAVLGAADIDTGDTLRFSITYRVA